MSMDKKELEVLFNLEGKVAVVTGGAGVLCATLCRALAGKGATVVVADRNISVAEGLVSEIHADGGQACAMACDVLEKSSIEVLAGAVLEKYGRVDILVNGAGGNRPQATTGTDATFFDLPAEALQWVLNLNLMGTILPCQVFGRIMAAQKSGTILNISSMNAFRPLTRVVAYSAAKAGVSNFTQWLAVHMAQEYDPAIRVNAIAPGFFLTEQNRYLLTEIESGELTKRGRQIIDHTPAERFGVPDDLVGSVLWLLAPASAFVTGVVIPIDGGFSAYSGV